MARATGTVFLVSLLAASCDRRGLGVTARGDGGDFRDGPRDLHSSLDHPREGPGAGGDFCDGSRDGQGPYASTPTYRESTVRFAHIAAGIYMACGVTSEGTVRCWGIYGDCRDLEEECLAGRYNFVPKSPAQTAKQISVFASYACAINASDSIDCWGGFRFPAHFEGAFSAISIPYAIRKDDGSLLGWDFASEPPSGSFVSLGGYRYYCGLLSDGTLTCWGLSLPDGSVDQPPGGVFTQLAVTSSFGCALEPDGEVLCWGWGSKGWNDSPFATPQPEGRFARLTGFLDCDSGGCVCGIRTDGSVACWGGLAGYPPPPGIYVEVAIGSMDETSRQWHRMFICALRNDGILVCWGTSETDKWWPP